MPYVDSSHYQHPLDKQTLAALKSIPGFTAVLKAFMKVFSERQWFIRNNSMHVKLSERQLPEIYDLLPPICERLGINVPHLYLQNDRSTNAYTSNETDPFIVLHAGLLEACDEEVVRGVLAHECGHIASHHVLYHTMGDLIMSGALAFMPGMNGLINIGLQAAYIAWMRASEYSADRASALALGGSDVVVKTCINLAGGFDSLDLNLDSEAFIEQAAEYEQAMNNSVVNKVFEVLMYSLTMDHPLNAYRALEVKRWCETPEFNNMINYIEGSNVPELAAASASSNALPGASHFCPQCGSQVGDADKFCKSCGAPQG